MMRVVLLSAGLALLATAQDLYSLIPKPTDFYRINGNKHFGPTQIRYSMTVHAVAVLLR